jgi:hypothetical protein
LGGSNRAAGKPTVSEADAGRSPDRDLAFALAVLVVIGFGNRIGRLA